MGQTANITTLYKNPYLINSYKRKSNEFLYIYLFLQFLDKMFRDNKLLLTNSDLVLKENKIYLTLDVFYQRRCLLMIKRKINNRNMYQINNKSSLISYLVLNFFKKYLKNLVVIKFFNMNTLLNKSNKLYVSLLQNYSRFKSLLFPRRYSFFNDFLKVSILFFFNKITVSFYIKVLGEIFRILQKRRHSAYLIFIKTLFDWFYKKGIKLSNDKKFTPIKGLKFVINGKLKGKTRSSKTGITVGSVPLQSFTGFFEYSKLHVFTIYGVFGLKLWVHR